MATRRRAADPRRQELAALAQRLGAELSSARGDDAQIKKAFEDAVTAFMAIERRAGAPAGAEPAELACAEILRDGDGDDVPSAFDLAGATDDEYGDWGDVLADVAGY